MVQAEQACLHSRPLTWRWASLVTSPGLRERLDQFRQVRDCVDDVIGPGRAQFRRRSLPQRRDFLVRQTGKFD